MSQYPPPSGQPQQQLPSYAQPPGSSGYYGAPIGQHQFHMPVPDEPPQSNKKVNFGVRLIYIYVGCLAVGLIVDFLPGYQNDGDRVGEVISRGAPLVGSMLITAVSMTVAIVVATFYKKGYTAARITAGVLAIVQGLFLLMQVALAAVAILVVWMLTPDADKDNVFRVASENPLAVAAFIAAALPSRFRPPSSSPPHPGFLPLLRQRLTTMRRTASRTAVMRVTRTRALNSTSARTPAGYRR